MTIIQGGKLYYDIPIGILCLESYFPKMHGHLRNPTTYSFPTLVRVLTGIDIPRMLFNPTPDLAQPFIDAAQELERDGVSAITGSCGFMALFQKEIAESVKIPVFMSSLLQLPIIRLTHGPEARIGILTASQKALTPKHLEACGTSFSSVHIQGMEGNPEFWETIIEGKRNNFHLEKLEKEIVETATSFAQEKSLNALLLECTDLPPFTQKIQQATKIPVYDINSLMEMIYRSVRWL